MSETDKPTDAGQPGAAASGSTPTTSQAGTAPDTQGGEHGSAPPVDVTAVLEARIKELESQQNDLTDRLLRAHAEMDNVRKRFEREKSDTAKYAISKFALDIVGISDNFQRAISSIPPGAAEQDGTLKSLAEGVEMTERAFVQVLERHGVTRIDPKGQPFNPNLHQAVMESPSLDVPAGSVLQVFQPGYMIEDRVLRPAMVVVARGGAEPAGAAQPPAPQDQKT